MDIKKYLRNLWINLKSETGQLSYWDEIAKKYANYGGIKATGNVGADLSVPRPGASRAVKAPNAPTFGGLVEATPNNFGGLVEGKAKITNAPKETGVVTPTNITPTQTVSRTGSSSGGGYSLASAPEAPDLMAGLSAEDIARIEKEASMLTDLEFEGAFRQLGQNLVESKRVAEEEKEGTIPVYEKSMRDTAATVANAIGSWAQRLNQLGMLRSGAYGRGVGRLEAAGVEQKGGLQQALAERLDDISTRAADYERDVLDLRAGLEKEKGLRQATRFETLKREELVFQRDTRQMTFQNEMQRANFTNTMNQMIWQRQMSERQLNAQLEAQNIENQMLQARISQLYGSGSSGTNQISPSDWQLSYYELASQIGPQGAMEILGSKAKELGLSSDQYNAPNSFLQTYKSGLLPYMVKGNVGSNFPG